VPQPRFARRFPQGAPEGSRPLPAAPWPQATGALPAGGRPQAGRRFPDPFPMSLVL